MKNLSKVFILTLLISLGLSACNQTSDPVPPVVDETIDGNHVEDVQDAVMEEINADTVLINQQLENAIRAKDVDTCSTINNSTKAKECEDIITSLISTDEAVAAVDLAKCSKLSLPGYKENCETKVQFELDKENSKQEAINLEEEMTSIESKAMQASDYKLCESITDENWKKSCKYNVISNQVITTKDFSLCGQIGDKDLEDQCKQNSAE